MRVALPLSLGIALVVACSSSSVEGPTSAPAPATDAGETPAEDAGLCSADQNTAADCCGVACTGAPHAQPSCRRQKCAFTCDDGRSDCDGNPANGCESASASDPANCGACGRSCGGAACVTGLCDPATLVSSTGTVEEIRVEGADLFWLERNPTSSRVTYYRCPVARCQSPYEVVYQPTESGGAFEVDATQFFFVEGSRLRRCARTGACTPSDIVDEPQIATREIAIDATHVFWTHSYAGTDYGRVRRADKDGSNIVSLATADATTRAFANVRVYGPNVYFDDIGGVGRKHFVCSVNGCAGTPVPTYPEIGGVNLGGRYVDDSGFYLAQVGQMWRGAPAGGAAVQIGASFVSIGGESITGTAGTIYWTKGSSGDIFSLPKGSLKPVFYRSKLGDIGHIQASGGFLYFTANSGARISRLAL